MRTSISLAAGVLIAVLLSGCCNLCEDKNKTVKVAPSPTGIDQVVAPTPDGGPCEAKQTEPADPTHARVTAGTYCVCDAELDPVQQHPGTLVAGAHLAKNERVVIGPTTDDALNVVLADTSVTFSSFSGGAQLMGFASYPHEPAPAVLNPTPGQMPGSITHLIKIRPYTPTANVPDPPGCTGNIISLDFCFLRDDGNAAQWACSRDIPGAHFGDIHAKN